MRIGILTGGGDVPGLNPCIKAFVYRAIDEGHEVLGIRRGWGGLFFYNLDDPTSGEEYIMPLDKQNTRTIDRTGGTILHTSRTNPSKIRAKDVPDFLRGEGFDENEKDPLDFTPHVLRVIERLGIEVLVPIGGDDTLGYGARLYEENFPIVAIPKTMDNDVFGTDYCIGFSTAVTRSVQFIHQLRTSIGSHERLGVIELFGRNSGETCLISSHLSGVDRAVISEVPFDPEKLASFLIEDRKDNPSNYAIMAISEGARFVGGKIVEYGQADAFGHKKLGGIGMLTSEALKEITGLNTIYQQVAYLMRSGAPDSLDLMVATNYANIAMDLIKHGKFGSMVALQGGKYTYVPANTVSKGLKRVDVEQLYDTENYRPKLRGVEGKPMFLY
ncbi:MAG TPA: 6-phosphofructokinase [Anaerolineales bacterium]|nr:6-phosphofructokinase [Anaerolineales bacterium]